MTREWSNVAKLTHKLPSSTAVFLVQEEFKILNDNFLNGIVQFYSTGTNSLNNTNNLKSNIINDISYNSQNLITNNGFKNNFNVYLKNLNSVGKNVSGYKNSPQIELIGLIDVDNQILYAVLFGYYHHQNLLELLTQKHPYLM